MWFWNKILASAVSLSMLGSVSQCSVDTKAERTWEIADSIENIEPENIDTLESTFIPKVQEETQKEISLCLTQDDSDSFTYKKDLESIEDPNNIILEFPLWPLFQEYWDKHHPLRVHKVEKNFRALLWKWWIENLMETMPQKISGHWEQITSDTQYMINDTLRFSLINPLLKDDFPQYLPDQLMEEWFEDSSDRDAQTIDRIINWNNQNWNKKSDFIYDIVVKKVPSWKSALALYRNWKLFMVTYASIWKDKYKTRKWEWVNPRTKMWQYEIINRDPYKRSITHNDSPMPFWLNYYGWYWIHQWNVTWYPASHWCVRLPGIYAAVLYSLLENSENVDVFISKNLYKSLHSLSDNPKNVDAFMSNNLHKSSYSSLYNPQKADVFVSKKLHNSSYPLPHNYKKYRRFHS